VTGADIHSPELRMQPAAAPAEHSGVGPSHTLRAILVDDSFELRMLLRILLQDAGWEVVGEAGDGDEAVALCEATPCEVVIMDLNMPRMDGIEATRQIKRRRPETTVVAFTCTADALTSQALLDAGASCHFDKPDVNALVAHLALLASPGAAARRAA
jgi:DNA-binding NarL/FixJ family response regulator